MSVWKASLDFPESAVRPIPFQYNDDTMIYTTKYKISNPEKCGIIEYDVETDSHKIIKRWSNTKYFPKGNVSVYAKNKGEIIFVGGSDVLNNKEPYSSILIYNIKQDIFEEIDINIKTDGGLKAVLTHNERYLHIIGGSNNSYHIMYDFKIKKMQLMHRFIGLNDGLYAHGLVYNQTQNMLIFFGGYQWPPKYSNQFWKLSLNDSSSLLSMDVRTKYLMNGFINQIVRDNKLMYAESLNDVILSYLGKDAVPSSWKQDAQKTLLKKVCGFGYILYDDRYIITFGGQSGAFIDNIYYIDLLDDNATWIESKIKCPETGYCNAVLMDNKIVHLLPYEDYSTHYSIEVELLLQPLVYEEEGNDENNTNVENEKKQTEVMTVE